MIDLMLQDARKPTLGLDADFFALWVARLDGDTERAGHVVAHVARNAQAALGAEFFIFACLDDLWIHQRDLVIFIFRDQHPHRFTNLRGGQSHAGRFAHRFPQILHQPFEPGVIARHFLGLRAQDRMLHCEDFA